MLNKNDPLIGAVQEVMKKNQAERDAVRLVNEKFGITDRKALPREKQGEWDAAYKSVLTEGLHPNQKQLDMNKNNKLDSQDFKMLRAKKPMEEATDGDTTSPSSMGIKKPDYATGTPDYANKGPQMVNRGAKTSLPSGVTVKEEMTDAQMAKREKIVKALKKKMAGFKDRYGERAKDVMYATATKQAMKENNEGFNDRHGMSEAASAEKQAMADQIDEANILTDKGKMNPRSMAARIRYKGALASGKARPVAPTGELKADNNYTLNKYKDKAETFARRATGNVGDVVGLTDPKRGEGLAKFNPGAAQAGDLAGAASMLLPGRGATTAATTASKVKQGTSVVTKAKSVSQAAKEPASVTSTATQAGQKAASAAEKYKARVSAIRREVPGSQAKPTPAQAKTPSGVPAVARTPGNKTGIAKSEKTGPWNRVGPQAPARPTTPNAAAGNAARTIARQKMAQTAKDIRAGAGKVASAVRANPKLAAGAAGGAALGAFAVSNMSNKPSSSTAQPTTSAGGGSGGSTSTAPAPKAKSTAPAAAPAAKKPAAPAPAKPVAAKPALQTRYQRDTSIDSSGKSMKGPGGVTTGKVTGTTVTQKPMMANRKLPGK